MQGDVFGLTLVDYTYINPNKAALEFAKANHPDVYSAYADSPITNPPAEAIAKGHGIQDVGESGIEMVTVKLYDNTSPVHQLVATSVTNSSGRYQFSGLCGGTYYVALRT